MVLLATAASYFAFAVAGSTLEPTVGTLGSPDADLVVDANFGEATTLTEAGERIGAIEQHLEGLEEVSTSWSTWQRGRGTVTLEVHKNVRERKLLRALARQLEFQLSTIPGAVTVRALSRTGSTGGTVDLSGRLGSIPETDQEALAYRFLLKSTQLEDLREARALVVQRFAQLGIRPGEILSDWGAAQPVLRLEPRQDRNRREIDNGVSALRRATLFSPATAFPGEKQLGYRIVSPIGPQNETELRDTSILTAALPIAQPNRGRPYTSAVGGPPAVSAAHLFSVHRTTTPPSVLREDGRFVLPLTVRMRWNEVRRQETRDWMHSSLERLRVPSSIDIEKPNYHRWAFTKRRLDLLRSFAVLPLLLLVIASVRTNSLQTGGLILTSSAMAIAGTVLVLQAAATTATELTFLTLGASLALTLPMAIVTAGGALENPETRSNLAQFHRFVSNHGSTLALAAVVSSLAPFLVQLGAQSDIHPWVLPLRTAAAGTGVGLGSALVVVPLMILGRNQWRRYDRMAASGLAEPKHWTTQDQAPRLAVRNLTKVYKVPPSKNTNIEPIESGQNSATNPHPRIRSDGFHALHRLNFELTPGIVGLLGPNGAGKTTLLRTLCGLLEPTRGRVLFHGTAVEPLNLGHYRHHVGFLPQGFNAYENTTAETFLDYWALEGGLLERSARQKEIERVLDLVNLRTERQRNVRDFSGGMRRRIGIARALLGDPPILIVDEPTTGLDVASRNRLRDSLLAVAQKRIVLFSTHIASDIAAAARRILILSDGQLLFDGSARELIERARGQVFELLVSDDQLRNVGRRYRVTTRVRTPSGIRLHLVLAPGQAPPEGAKPRDPSVEEAYLAVMAGRELSSAHANNYGQLLDLNMD